jgi:cyclohexanecarboxylate-CoA ligase
MSFETILTPQYIQEHQSKWPNKTILDYLHEAIEKNPDKIAIVDKDSRYTYKELGQLVDRVALGLLELGLQKGDVISFQLPNWNEFIILHFAVTRIGAVSNPLIPIYREREIGFMVKMAESKMIVIPDTFRGFNYPKMIEQLLPQWPAMEHVFVVGDDVPKGMKPFSSLLKEPLEGRGDIARLDAITHDPNDVTEIIFTSGTTGEPKGVMHTHNTINVAARFWIDHLSLTPDDVIFMASTFAHQTGFLYGVHLPFIYGGTGVYQDIWNPQQFLELIGKERITFTASATPFLQDTVRAAGEGTYNLDTLRVFIAVGAPIPRVLVKEAREKLPCRILTGWGQTEDGMVTRTLVDDKEEKLINTDGAPFPTMEVKIVDVDGKELPPQTEGDVMVKGPALFVGYFKRLEQTKAEFTDNWFNTGDRAVMDEDGYIRITGRVKDIIIRGGENIPVAYVENVLYEHPDIANVQIIAVPDERLQEKACAVICMKENKDALTMESMKAFLTDKGIAKQYWPEYIEVVDEFPTTASGKIQKFKLREMVEENITIKA